VSLAQSDGAAHTWNVSVAAQDNLILDAHVATQAVATDWVVQAGSVPPFTTTVAQQSGVLPPQSACVSQATVFAGVQDAAHVGVPVFTSKQQTCPPLHGVAGQVVPASPGPLSGVPESEPPEAEPLLVPLPDVLPLPELLVLALPELPELPPVLVPLVLVELPGPPEPLPLPELLVLLELPELLVLPEPDPPPLPLPEPESFAPSVPPVVASLASSPAPAEAPPQAGCAKAVSTRAMTPKGTNRVPFGDPHAKYDGLLARWPDRLRAQGGARGERRPSGRRRGDLRRDSGLLLVFASTLTSH
jgi:hypothetical protein